MRKIGYARVSTGEQNLDLQLDALREASCDLIYQETESGAKDCKARPELDACLKALREGDTLVVWRLDRLGRRSLDVLLFLEELENRKIHFESLNEKFDTNSPLGKAMVTLIALLSQLERDLISQRTAAGLAAARARGRLGGRPRSLDKAQINHIKRILENPDVHVRDVAKQFRVSLPTLYRHCGVVKPKREP